MVFNSYIFILVFLPLFVISYFVAVRLIGNRARKALVILAGIVFYTYGGIEAAILFGSSIFVNLALATILARLTKRRKILLGCGIALNVGFLLFFKYSNFTIRIFNQLFAQNVSLMKLILPLGISFFTFQQIMYLLSVYRKEIEKIRPLDYLAYILYFPKLIMGPLVEPNEFISQINNPALGRLDWDNIAIGLKVFSLGLFKKMLLADTFAKAVSWGFTNASTATAGDLFLVMLFYTFEIYFDFSGYSDMAVGVSRMINITLPMNFDSPYKALSVKDFWRRWHMSLTRFLTKNIYYPLGGSKEGKIRTYFNILIVFLVSGIWHGANWTFIMWGGYMGYCRLLNGLSINNMRNNIVR